MEYRSEIDGLRAIAVLPVILFHAGFSLFSGGFVGVDVFFVISGYLITVLLIDDIENGKFSLIDFYERRARRILPALLVVIVICIPFAWYLMAPDQMRGFTQSIVAVSFFASNILFWRQTGYFDIASEEKPLLHTWSLAVEEQYYLFFPLLLIVIWRFGAKKVFIILFTLSLISLGLSEWGWRREPSANFFLAPSRMWELFVGSLTAIIIYKKGVMRSDFLSTIGVISILTSIFLYDESTPFPSLYTVLPVSGVVLIILFTRDDSYVRRVLSLRPLVALGLISYSAYLWHQPVFAFARIHEVSEPSSMYMAVLVVITLLIATLSLIYVESPFRKKCLMGSQKALFGGAIIAFSMLISIGLAGHLGIFKSKIGSIYDSEYGGQGSPWVDTEGVDTAHFLLYGDSHAKQYYSALVEEFGAGAMIAESACISLPGLVNQYKKQTREREKCVNLSSELLMMVDSNSPPLVIISQRWDKDLFDLQTGLLIGRTADTGFNVFAERFKLFLNQLKTSKVIIIGNVPAAYVASPAMKKGMVACLAAHNDNCPFSYERKLREGAELNDKLRVITEDYPNVTFYDPANALCDSQKCYIVKDKVLLYSDHAHLTKKGAHIVATKLREML
jgi:peptidoglycan/LPS O-acetylase OafA/YrhL